MVNLVQELKEVWHHHVTKDLVRAEVGLDTVNLFKPKRAHNSDIAKIIAVGYTTLYTMQKKVDGPIPDAVIEAVAQSLLGIYGLARRRGRGEMAVWLGAEKEAAKYIDLDTFDVVAPKKRHAALKEYKKLQRERSKSRGVEPAETARSCDHSHGGG